MRGGTELGRVRGLGSAKEGAGHWWHQRMTAFVNIVLMLWFVVSLIRLPSLDYGIVVEWMRQPWAPAIWQPLSFSKKPPASPVSLVRRYWAPVILSMAALTSDVKGPCIQMMLLFL